MRWLIPLITLIIVLAALISLSEKKGVKRQLNEAAQLSVLGQNRQARQVLEQALEDYPNHPQIIEQMAYLLIDDQRPQDAETLIKQCLSTSPQGEDTPRDRLVVDRLHYVLAVSQVILEQFKLAEQNFKKVLKSLDASYKGKRVNHTEWKQLRANTLHQLGKLPNLLQPQSTGAQDDPQLLEESRRWFEKMTQEFPEDARGYNGLGLYTLRHKGPDGRIDYALSRAHFERALTLDPKNVHANFHLGLVALFLNDPEIATRQMETLHGLGQPDSLAWSKARILKDLILKATREIRAEN